MADYSTDHASALIDVSGAGAAVTFTRTTPGTYDGTTGQWSASSTASVAGYAIEDIGDPDEYRELSVIQSDPATLFFTPSTFGSLPVAGYAVTWGGVVRTVKRVRPIAPNGTAIAATIVVAL